MTFPYWQCCLCAVRDFFILLAEKARTSNLHVVIGLVLLCTVTSFVSAATVPPGFTETVIAGPAAGGWNQAVGVTFENNGRMYVWERVGRVWFQDPGDTDFTLLLDISEEVGAWGDHGLLGFALDPNFRVNGHIYLLYAVDRHYLFHFGTPTYNPSAMDTYSATIGRLTRYTCRASDGFHSTDLASRRILIGPTKETGIPIASETHGIGTLLFGTDGTLLVSCGDGASPGDADIGGGNSFGTFGPQALADGIISPKEDVGAFRSQLLDCNNGKILRVDPATGDGIPSNPFYEPGNPGSRRSRVYALGLRNPCRMTLKPGTGSHDPTIGQPGVLYLGDVGWFTWESLKVVTGPGQNLGWPVWEGLSPASNGATGFDVHVPNRDAPNPLYPAPGCSQYFSFLDLLKEDSLNPADQPPFPNPCNLTQRIPASIPQFLRTRPILDWHHLSPITRTPVYGPSGEAQIVGVGAPGSPVSGVQFPGNCAIGGTWYTGAGFPPQYRNTYFFADWGKHVIKNLVLDTNDRPVAVNDFISNAGAVVWMTQHPTDQSFYYVSYTWGDAGTIRKLSYTGNRTPVAVASVDQTYGPSPFSALFSSFGSTDPDGQPLTFSWNFGDGSAPSTQANPAHTFSAPTGVPTKFTVTLTVTDTGGLSAQKNLTISVNNTPPAVTITSPTNGSFYSMFSSSTFDLAASVSDAEFADSQLLYTWETLLHHNEHDHVVATDTNHSTTTTVSPIGCDGINIYHYTVVLTVSDPAGLSTVRTVDILPDCDTINTPAILSDIPNQTITQDQSTAPIAFTIADNEVLPENLQLSAISSNPALVPNGNIIFGGVGANRTLTITPLPGQTGTTIITVNVDDGPSTVSDSFLLTVNALPGSVGTFSSSSAIIIPSVGPSAPYASSLNVSGLGGMVSEVTVQLRDLSHTWPNDVDVLLVSPGGKKVLLMSDAGGGTSVNNINITLSDLASSALSSAGPLVTGTFKPADYTTADGADAFSGPAPLGPYETTLAAFNDQPANGAWVLYITDDGPGDQGSFAGGWSLTIRTTGGGAPVPAPPTISEIANQLTTIDLPTGAIPFTINDTDTPLETLTVSGSSDNQTLVANANIVFGGGGANRTVTVTPAAGQTGTATITVTVSDGVLSASDTFVLTVNAVNTAPAISDMGNQTIEEDQTTAALNFTVGDSESAAGSLIVTRDSSNPALVPVSNIVLGGGGANRTVSVTPVANQSGTATITVTVSDGQLSATDTFVVTVNAVNDSPTVSDIGNQSVSVNGATAAIPFTVGDVETAAGSLTVSGASSNQSLVSDGNIIFGGSGANRTVTITPEAGQTGSATITVAVSDGALSASDTFVLTVSSVVTGTQSFTNEAPVVIPSFGAGTPYPSTIEVSGMGGTISQMSVSLHGFNHTWPSDTDVLLVGPDGQKVMLLSDVGGNVNPNNVIVTLSDDAVSALTATGTILAGAYLPSNVEPGELGELDSFAAPAPAGPYGAAFSVFNGQSANGTWSLYVTDDGPGDQGSLAAGWSLTITTTDILELASIESIVEPRLMVRLEDKGMIRITVAGGAGRDYAVEASNDLVNWARLGLRARTGDPLEFIDASSSNSVRFYRAVSLPTAR